MSYLEDPRVFLATERTLLAWIRTEVSILVLVFVMRKFGFESGNNQYLDVIINSICIVVIVLSVLATFQALLTISKLGEKELPSRFAKLTILISGIISNII